MDDAMNTIFDNAALVFGCGNILYGDDGFGPAVIQHLTQHYALPPGVLALDMGTSVRDTLVDLTLSEKKPGLLLIVDAVEIPGHAPGEIFEIPITQIPDKKTSDFSLHQFPTVSLLAKIEAHAKIKIVILVAQIEHIPDEVRPGLSKRIQAAVIPACDRIAQILAQAPATA
jgi:coenzyme F420 hydrogenase subunit delta